MEYKLRKDAEIVSNNLEVEDYLPYIEEEVRIIKENFPQEVIEEKLNVPLEKIDGSCETECIYGLLTGSCFSSDAHAVIFKLPTIVASSNPHLKYYKDRDAIYRGQYFLTPIEHYILPTSNEEEEQDDDLIYPDSYYERVKGIIDLLREN